LVFFFLVCSKKISELFDSLGGRLLLPGLNIDVLTAELPEDQALVWLPEFIKTLP
jgi:MioC protein